jgi:2-keto-3-deoxy-L-rhamnonate aldolase RhmA
VKAVLCGLQSPLATKTDAVDKIGAMPRRRGGRCSTPAGAARVSAEDQSRLFAAVLVETVELLAEPDDVLKREGLDSLVLAPQDLSGTMGRLGETTHPEVIAAMKTVASRARAAGKFIGSGLGTNPEFARALRLWCAVAAGGE